MDKLRVLVVTPLYYPYPGGASVYFSTLTLFLKNKVDLVVFTVHHPEAPIVEIDEIRIFRIVPNIKWPPYVRGFIGRLVSFVALLLIYALYKPKLIHSHCSGDVSFSAALFSLISGVPIIKDVRDVQIFEKLGHKIKLGKVEKFFSIGHRVNKKLYALGISGDKIAYVPVIVTPDIFDVGEYDGERRILFVGDLTKKKGILVLLEAFRIIAKEWNNVTLVIVGDGPERRRCEKFIKDSGLEGKVELLGPLSHRKTLEQIKRSLFLVLPSESEGLPRVILEAFALGKPVISTPQGEIPNVVKDGINGLLIEKIEPKEVARAIDILLIDEKLRKKLGWNARKYYEKCPSWLSLSENVVKEYEKISK